MKKKVIKKKLNMVEQKQERVGRLYKQKLSELR